MERPSHLAASIALCAAGYAADASAQATDYDAAVRAAARLEGAGRAREAAASLEGAGAAFPQDYALALRLGWLWFSAADHAAARRHYERLGLPLLIVPFNVTVPLVLAVMRQRVADGRPHAVDFEPGTPEQNLAYFRSRAERFGSVLGLRLAAPSPTAVLSTNDGGLAHARR